MHEALGGFVLLGTFKLQRRELVLCRHRHAGMYGAENLGLHLGVETVREPLEALMQASPELDPVGHGWARNDRPEAGDVLMADFTAFPAGFDEAELQPARGLAEANKHVVARL